MSNPLTRKDRALTAVPVVVWWLLIAGLASQIAWHAWRPGPTAAAVELVAPPKEAALRTVSLGEPSTLSRLLMLRLQAFDNQPGISVPFRDLDYKTVIAWLDAILQLDPRNPYPLLAASRLYGMVPVPDKQRRMTEWVHERFKERPDERWRWLAHAAFVARHGMDDLALALKYARSLRTMTTDPTIPGWATQMEIFLLEDLGEIEAARILLGGLLESGQLDDPAERNFLEGRLRELEARSGSANGD